MNSNHQLTIFKFYPWIPFRKDTKRYKNINLHRYIYTIVRMTVYKNQTHQATASLYTNPAAALLTISKHRSAPSMLK